MTDDDDILSKMIETMEKLNRESKDLLIQKLMEKNDDKFNESMKIITDCIENNKKDSIEHNFELFNKMIEAQQDPNKELNNSSLTSLLLFMIMMGRDNKKDEGKLQEGFTIAQVLDMAFIQIKEINKKLETLSENVSDIQSKVNKMIA